MKPAHYIQANTNGRLHPADEPSLSPLNRGYLYGDAIYEVWRTYDGVVFAWDEHWQRLLRSAAALHLELPWSAGEIFAEIKRTVAAYRERSTASGELYIRLQITRGGGAIGLDVALADRADFVLMVQPCPVTPSEKVRTGLRLALATSLRRNPIESLNPAWKTGNYLNNILCLREARARGADEVVMLNRAGEITESAVSNIAFVRGGVVVTPPLAVGILGGITRDFLLRGVATAAGVAIREEIVCPEDLAGCSECFLLSTTKDVSPVSAIDDVTFAVGDDTVGLRLKRAFESEMRTYVAARPHQRV
ncbi:MAG: aminotransferase class IV family protein [Verrucomicrobia bacterium]|nr:aminotransferase class IV family protein [Verrucomicrobiota bacterium]